MKKIITAVMFVVLAATHAFTQPTVEIKDEINSYVKTITIKNLDIDATCLADSSYDVPIYCTFSEPDNPDAKKIFIVETMNSLQKEKTISFGYDFPHDMAGKSLRVELEYFYINCGIQSSNRGPYTINFNFE